MFFIKDGQKSNTLNMYSALDGMIIIKFLFFKIPIGQQKRKPTELADVVFTFGSKAIVNIKDTDNDEHYSQVYIDNKGDFNKFMNSHQWIRSVAPLNKLGKVSLIRINFPEIPEDDFYEVELLKLTKQEFIQRMERLEFSNKSALKNNYTALIIVIVLILLVLLFIYLNLHSQNIIAILTARLT